VRRDDEGVADILEAAEKIAVPAAQAGRRSTATRIRRS
jgi:hypothetical protein